MTPQPARPRSSRLPARGFSLVELIVVIVVLGILGTSLALLVRGPVQAYFDGARRAQLLDVADTASRRIQRELEGAVPNTVRATSSGTVQYLEFTPISDAGRYRAATSAGNEPTGTNALDVTSPTASSFQVLDAPVTVPASARLVIFNLGAGSTGYDLYAGANLRSVTTAAGAATAIGFTSTGVALGADSPDRRFYLVTTPVSYVCTPNAAGTGTLYRYSGYPLQATQPSSTSSSPLSSASASLVLDNVSACSFAVANAILANTNAVSLTLQLANSNAASEVVSLYSQVYLGSAP